MLDYAPLNIKRRMNLEKFIEQVKKENIDKLEIELCETNLQSEDGKTDRVCHIIIVRGENLPEFEAYQDDESLIELLMDEEKYIEFQNKTTEKAVEIGKKLQSAGLKISINNRLLEK